MAKPRMRLYMETSAKIVATYLRYVSASDLHVYSIDECFIDLTPYISLYGKSAKEIVNLLRDAVFKDTGITATAGIGTNLFLAKVALDVTAKHVSDNIGVLDEQSFKEVIWPHRPITDIWQIGKGIAARLQKYGIYDLGGVAHADVDLLYREFGVNAEYLIDHAWGIRALHHRRNQGLRTRGHVVRQRAGASLRLHVRRRPNDPARDGRRDRARPG